MATSVETSERCERCGARSSYASLCTACAVREEREACAALVDAYSEQAGMVWDGKALAASIRARGQTFSNEDCKGQHGGCRQCDYIRDMRST